MRHQLIHHHFSKQLCKQLTFGVFGLTEAKLIASTQNVSWNCNRKRSRTWVVFIFFDHATGITASIDACMGQRSPATDLYTSPAYSSWWLWPVSTAILAAFVRALEVNSIVAHPVHVRSSESVLVKFSPHTSLNIDSASWPHSWFPFALPPISFYILPVEHLLWFIL